MSFVKVNVKEQIEEKKKKDPEFKKAWDEYHNQMFKDTMIGLLEAIEIKNINNTLHK